MIRSQNKIRIESNSSTMSDLVFLLLIFFMITSTLISPNAVPLSLPQSTNENRAKSNVTVYIVNNEDNYLFYVDGVPSAENELSSDIEKGLLNEEQSASILLRSDNTVPVQYVVNVIDAVNAINDRTGHQHKVILATSPK